MMQANWSLVLNAILLVGVIVAIGLTLRAKHKKTSMDKSEPMVGSSENTPDEIISVRKITVEPDRVPSVIRPNLHSARSIISKENVPLSPRHDVPISRVKSEETIAESPQASADPEVTNILSDVECASSLMIFLLAKEQRQLAGYELLQTILAAGLRFGEGQLFHRHQSPNGQGPVLCSLAAATKTGLFDLQNIGSFSVRGLCLFMHTSGNPTIDEERFEIMLETAKKLSDDLDTHLLDDRQAPFSKKSMDRYNQLLNKRNTEQGSMQKECNQYITEKVT